MTKAIADTPNEPEYVDIGFNQGIPVSLNGEKLLKNNSNISKETQYVLPRPPLNAFRGVGEPLCEQRSLTAPAKNEARNPKNPQNTGSPPQYDKESTFYIHHDIMLPSYPICLEWLDFDPTVEESTG